MASFLTIKTTSKSQAFINHTQVQHMLGATGDAKQVEQFLYFIHSNIRHLLRPFFVPNTVQSTGFYSTLQLLQCFKSEEMSLREVIQLSQIAHSHTVCKSFGITIKGGEI